MYLKYIIQKLVNAAPFMAVMSGLLLGIGFIFPILWWLSIVGIVLLLNLITTRGVYIVSLSAFTAWGIKSALSLIWFWSAYPIDWVAISSPFAQIAVVAFYWLTSSLWLGTGGICFAVCVFYLNKKVALPKEAFVVVVPVLWLMSELVAAKIFSIFTLGPGSFVQSYFSFGQIGYLLGVTPFGVFAAGGFGVYGLTLILVLTGTLFWYVCINKMHTAVPIAVGITGLFLVVFAALYKPTYQIQNVTINSINTQFSSALLGLPDGDVKKIDVLSTALSKALAYPADFVVLPEDSRYFSSLFGDISSEKLASQFEFIQGSTSAIIIDSGRLDLLTGQTVLRAQVYDGRAKKIYQFDKQYLVPQGEYVPYLYGLVMRLLGFGAAVDAISINSSYTPGLLTQNDELPAYIPGVLFCFESVRPDGVSNLMQNRKLPFIAHPISHGWFNTPEILWQQLDVMLRIQARQSGLPIVSAGNMATGKVYLPNGAIEPGSQIESGDLFTIIRFEI